MHKKFHKKSIKIAVGLNLLKNICIIGSIFCIFPLNMTRIDAISILFILYCFQILTHICITRNH